MPVSRLKTWTVNEILGSADLNSEFDNILNNAQSLGSPRSATLDLDGFQLTLDQAGTSYARASTQNRWDITLGSAVLFKFDGTVTSPVNGFSFTGGATGVAPKIEAIGSDTDISVNIVPKGAGNFLVNGVAVAADPLGLQVFL